MSRPSKLKPAAAVPAPADAQTQTTPAEAGAAAAPDPAKALPQVAQEPTGAASAPASAAAEAAAAPVDPHMSTGPGASPDDVSTPDGTAPSLNPPETVVPMAFIDPDVRGVEIEIVSAVLIDGVEVRSGRVIVTGGMADDLVRAGAATRAPD